MDARVSLGQATDGQEEEVDRGKKERIHSHRGLLPSPPPPVFVCPANFAVHAILDNRAWLYSRLATESIRKKWKKKCRPLRNGEKRLPPWHENCTSEADGKEGGLACGSDIE